MMRALWRALFGCRHHFYRERRQGVLMFICAHCNHAVPVLERTKTEQRQAVRAGALVPLKARKVNDSKLRKFGA
jgi:hypothetical protein